MKLVVTGATGFVATEIIRQSLSIPKITSVIALARRPVSPPLNLGPAADVAKLHSAVLDNYGSYPDHVIKQLAGADACIWTVAITPSKQAGIDFEEVRRVCQEHALLGLRTIFKAHSEGRSPDAPPFRFIYMSGVASERDQTKTPSWKPEYCLMRGEAETQVLAFAAEHKGALEACVAKPGFIAGPGRYWKTIAATALNMVMGLPKIDVGEISAAMIHQVMQGFEKEPLENADLVRIGQQALKGTE